MSRSKKRPHPSLLPAGEGISSLPLGKTDATARVRARERFEFVGVRARTFAPSVARASFAILLAFTLLLQSSCSNRRITRANVDEVADGMSKKQVESILGPPTAVDNTDFVVMKKMTYLYRQENGNVTVVFKDDKVIEKQTTLSK